VTVTFEDGELRQVLRQHVQRTQPELLINNQDQILTYPGWLGSGHKRDIDLPSGICLTFHEYRLKRDVIYNCTPSQEDCIEFVFSQSYRSSFNNTRIYGPRQAFIEPPTCQPVQWREYAEQDYRAVDIHLDRLLLQTLLAGAADPLPADLRAVMANEPCPEPGSPVVLTPPMEAAVEQMLHCPFHGISRTLFLEAKSLELISLFIAATQASPSLAAALSRDDRDRIHQAQRILRENLQTPPSLMALARQVGLNDRKLKEGFRQLLDTTVFGYLTQQRLEWASHLLAQQHPIASVSFAVGYASPTAFSGAFRRRFGMSPKAYQMEQRCVA
jgi:AraC family transcriptional activator of pyochelin receptor